MVLGMADEEPGNARDAAVLRAAANVRSALGWRNITGSAAAKDIGVGQAYLSRRLNGDVPFDAGDLALLARLLGLTPGHLLDGEPWPEASRKEADAAPAGPIY
jgi:transcriptional regulator with XRE-family HTH domain